MKNRVIVVGIYILCFLSYIHTMMSLGEAIVNLAMENYLQSKIRTFSVIILVIFVPLKDQLIFSGFATLYYYQGTNDGKATLKNRLAAKS